MLIIEFLKCWQVDFVTLHLYGFGQPQTPCAIFRLMQLLWNVAPCSQSDIDEIAGLLMQTHRDCSAATVLMNAQNVPFGTNC